MSDSKSGNGVIVVMGLNFSPSPYSKSEDHQTDKVFDHPSQKRIGNLFRTLRLNPKTRNENDRPILFDGQHSFEVLIVQLA